MFLLDTNVVSELRRPRPHPAVVQWRDSVAWNTLAVAAVTLGELERGLIKSRRSNPAEADRLEAWIDKVELGYTVLPMTGEAFRLWARLMEGRSDALYEDAMIAATALVNDRVIVTRNVRDFETLGLTVIDPFVDAR